MRTAPLYDVEDNLNYCLHGVNLDKFDCDTCLEEEIDSTCPRCGIGRADRLTDDGYACRECETVWTVNPDKTKTYYTEYVHKGETLTEMETVKS